MTHLPLNPVEWFVLLKRQDCEAVTALPDWSVRNLRSRENAPPHHVGRPADVGRTAAPVGEEELASELDSSLCLSSSVRTLGLYWMIRLLLFVFGVVMPYRVLRLRLIRARSRSR
jgi:hypothetical protein